MFPWEVLITGAVGIAGIGGTIFAARVTAKAQTTNLLLSIDNERDRARLADKRQVYANFIAALHKTMFTMLIEKVIEAEPDPRSTAHLEASRVSYVIYDRLSEVELIGSEEVASQARALTRSVLDFLFEILDSSDPLDMSVVKSFDAQVDLQELQLYQTMRADLGVRLDSLNRLRPR